MKPLPPGALNTADAASYDFLRTLQGAIDGFKSRYNDLQAAEKAVIKDPLNKAIASFNVAQAAWQAQHAAGSGDLTATNLAINQVLQDIAALNAAFSKKPAATPAPISFLSIPANCEIRRGNGFTPC